MSVEINTKTIHASYASVINRIQPNANIYDNPNQQGTTYPAWFIVHRSPVEVRSELGKIKYGKRYSITYNIDIWYMIEQNLACMFDKYRAIGEALDANLEYLPIFGTDIVVHVFDRSWSVEMTALKYSTTLRLLVYNDCAIIPDTMGTISDLNEYLKGQQ